MVRPTAVTPRVWRGICAHLTSVPMLGDIIAAQAARNYRTLRAKGITIRKTPDLIIGTYCIKHHHILLYDDRDFDPMREHLGLLAA